jgi:magnesium-transporting ATPase (P-type)
VIAALDLVTVHQGAFPADMLLLDSVHEDGACYVDTMNLDGETNLKRKQVLYGAIELVRIVRGGTLYAQAIPSTVELLHQSSDKSIIQKEYKLRCSPASGGACLCAGIKRSAGM